MEKIIKTIAVIWVGIILISLIICVFSEFTLKKLKTSKLKGVKTGNWIGAILVVLVNVIYLAAGVIVILLYINIVTKWGHGSDITREEFLWRIGVTVSKSGFALGVFTLVIPSGLVALHILNIRQCKVVKREKFKSSITYCKGCGAAATRGTRFCKRCGYNILLEGEKK